MAVHGSLIETDVSFHKSFREGLQTGLIFSITSVVVIFLSYCMPWAPVLKKIRKKKRIKSQQICNSLPLKILQNENKEPHRSIAVDLLKRSRQITKEDLTLRMSYLEICHTTKYFSIDNVIGVGKKGMMYKAKLPNGCFIAVKRFYDSKSFKKQFDLEVMILGKYRHRNILPLVGFCIEKDARKERILVYSYMSNGRLSDWLSDGKRLEWPMRVRIALGIARGLSWLHYSLFTVHHRVTSQCVLLDENFEPKLSNFGKAKIINKNNYIGPGMSFTKEKEINYEIGYKKEDIYCFGIILLELITGRQLNLMTVLPCNPSDLHYAIDKTLIGKGHEEEIHSLLGVACDCIQYFPVQRPTMLEIYNKISKIWERLEMNEDSKTSMQTEVTSVSSGGDEIVELEA
ncbi:hypothetical protein L6164_037277 [Bauhinia variegata]|uniref:Uncharacterized protein n=1 Tax=Bauhinia variegata TaxID=167791 RepID=A0ACB9KJK1_BAUVA|nr:hypothetical protein L6164_037277 [Bauhinia variegata]